MKKALARLIIGITLICSGAGSALVLTGNKIPCEYINMVVNCYEQL